MNPKRQRRLYIIIFIILVLSITSALVLYALSKNINLFYSPSQLVKSNVVKTQTIRLGGLVVPHSVRHQTNSLFVRFRVTDNRDIIDVSYKGILPDLFREGQSIVAQGYYLQNKKFRAVEVLAKHDEKYMPNEVKASLKAVSKKSRAIL